ncbi:MAG: DUF4256 domain-containing protein [Gemmatimonadaceae bacterium]|nr:DUF4256 domain-containing protein [Gemmatimonadaceae bacterium]
MPKTPTLKPAEAEKLLATLKKRFEQNADRHRGISWSDVEGRLKKSPATLWTLAEMERTEGEPDVTGRDKKSGAIIFTDCCAESPKGRRSVCFDEAALKARKEHKPKASAMALAEQMGVEMLDEAQYRALQELGRFDAKTSSWIRTPETIRKLGGALFCDWRYGAVFTYHNGAESYYAARGFRGRVVV